MLAILTPILELLTELGPVISTAGMVAKVISSLTALVPALVQEGKDLVPTVKNVIAMLRDNSATTKDQLDALDVIEKKIDADYAAALKAAEAEDSAAEKAGS